MINMIRKPTNRLMKVTLTIFLFCSMLHLQGCPGRDKLKTFFQSGDRISAVGNTAIAFLPVLRDDGLIDEAEERDLTRTLTGVKDAIENFISKARSYKKVNPSVKSELAAIFDGVDGALDKFDAEGVLHLKNAKAQDRAKFWLTAMRGAARVIRSFLEEKDQ